MSAAPIAPAGPVNAFIQLWAGATSNVLSQIISTTYPMATAPPEVIPAPAVGDVQLTVTAAGTARGEMNVRIPAATALHLVKISTGSEPAELAANDRSAIEELLRQVAGLVVTTARPKGLEIQLTTILGEAPTWSPAASGWICAAPGAPHQSQFEWKLSAALAAGLVSAWQESSVTADQPPALEKKDAAAHTTPQPRDSNIPAKLDLLMDVELNVALRFGGRNILLKEILELGPGAVLELDRDIQDEADLLLDGRLIARGEVVAVEGNFGLRITELIAGMAS